jgi:hexulose-6-phosphate isomerase
MNHADQTFDRRSFAKTSLALVSGLAAAPLVAAEGPASAAPAAAAAPGIPRPSADRKLLLACKLGMIARKSGGTEIPLAERLRMAGEAGFDGVDFDEAGSYSPEQAREAALASGVFVHNAINHAHWGVRFTDPKAEVRAQARANLEHCLRVSHAAGGSGVLLVIGKNDDGPEAEITERCRAEIKKALPLAASLGQMVLFENVWNGMMYDHDKPPDQSPERFIKFVDSFNSPWIGMYYDLGNHWKYGQPSDWIRGFGRRCVKLDVKGFSRAKNKFVDITGEEDDLPWDKVREALAEVGYNGWATAEVGGGDVKRLTVVRKQMQKAFGL